MNINSSNIEPGVYEDADFSRDFAAAMRKGGQLCTLPAKTESPSGLAADSALGGCSSPDDVIVWPCGTWCHRYELAEYCHKADGFQVIRAGSLECLAFENDPDLWLPA